MGQPDTVNQLPRSCPSFEPKFDVVEKLLVEFCRNVLALGHTAALPTNEVKGVIVNLTVLT